MGAKNRVHVYYSGTVQGVGFRFTTLSLARRHRVAGWVRNLSDGRVEVLAEADRENISGFLADLEERMEPYIRDKQLKWQDSGKELAGFSIEY